MTESGCSRVQRRGAWLGWLSAIAGMSLLLVPPAVASSGSSLLRVRLLEERPWLLASGSAAAEAPAAAAPVPQKAQAESAGPTPFLAGFLSALVPGTGQLIQGQRRGWLYLGVEVAAWFSYAALRNAGGQAEEDFQQFGDGHWNWNRYETVTTCGPGLGPVEYEEEHRVLLDEYDNSRNDFYEDIGRQNAYACGWDEQGSRTHYESMRDESNSLFSRSHAVTGVVFVNHAVSAVDAAKSAAGRRGSSPPQVGLRLAPENGALALRVGVHRAF